MSNFTVQLQIQIFSTCIASVQSSKFWFSSLPFHFRAFLVVLSQLLLHSCLSPAGIYLLKVNNRNTRARCEICSKLTINTPERRHWRRSGVFIVNFEHISNLVLVFLLLTLNK